MQSVFGAGLFVLLLGAGVANAAPECLAKPDRTAAPGSHWYYRIDRATDQKCWYLKQVDARAPAPAAAQPAAPRPETDSQPRLFSWLSSAFSNIRRPTTPAAEPDGGARESNTADSARKRKAAKRAEAGRAPARASAQPAAAASEAPSLDPAASEALYQQFLQWRVKQLLAPELPPDLQGGTPR